MTLSAQSLFTDGHTFSAWKPDPISDDLLASVYRFARLGPTSANCSPLRIAFIRTPESKEKLRASLAKGNMEKTMSAPVTAILAVDADYLENLPKLFPVGYDASSWFTRATTSALDLGIRNTFLQIGYVIFAARSLGLDCGPMAGFLQSVVDETFFPHRKWRSLLLLNLGHGVDRAPYQRLPRLCVTEACTFL